MPVGTPLSWFVKAGFGTAIGSILAILIFLSIGVGIFILGFILMKSENKKPPEQRNEAKTVTGYILMVLGCIIGLGFGAPVLFEALSSEI